MNMKKYRSEQLKLATRLTQVGRYANDQYGFVNGPF